MAAHAVGREAEVAQRLERAELDLGARERLRDDRPGDVARVLARAVVVEHPRHDAGHAVGVVVVHRQEVGGDLRGRVDRLRVDRRALVQDQAAELVEVVVVRDRLAHVAVLLRRAGGVELLELDAVVDDRLQQVERPDRVRHHGLVRAVPRLADVRLRAEVEDVRLVGRLREVAHQVVDRRLVGQVGEDDAQLPAQVADVVQRARRGRAHERDHVGVELDERLGQVRAHEAVGAGDEARAAGVGIAELRLAERRARPRTRWLYRRRARMEGNRSRGRGAVRSGLLTGISTAAVSGSAAVLGIILSRKFGHGVKTDGFFAAYGVYLALVLVAASLRVIVLPRFVDRPRGRAARPRGRSLGGRPRAAARPCSSCCRVALAARDRRRCSRRTRAPATRRRCCCRGSSRRPSPRSTAASSRARSPRSTTTAGPRSGSPSARSPGSS